MLQRYKNILTKHLRPAIPYINTYTIIYIPTYTLYIIYTYTLYIIYSYPHLMTSRRRPDAALCGPNHARKKILKNGDCPGFLRCVILHHQKNQYAHSSETDIVSIHTGRCRLCRRTISEARHHGLRGRRADKATPRWGRGARVGSFRLPHSRHRCAGALCRQGSGRC